MTQSSLLSHTDALISPPYHISAVDISYRWLNISSVWQNYKLCLIRTTHNLMRMTYVQMLSHTDDLLSHLYDISAVAISYGQLDFSSLSHSCKFYLIRTTYHFMRMTWVPMLSHRDDLLIHMDFSTDILRLFMFYTAGSKQRLSLSQTEN